MPDLRGLKVCFLAGTLGQGGAERQLFYMLGALKQAGARPHVLSLTQGEFWESRIRDLGVDVTWVGRSESRLVRLAAIQAVLRQDRPDVLQSQHFFTNLYAMASARMLGLTEIGAIRTDGISELRTHGRVLGRLSLRSPRLVAANSRYAIQSALDHGMPAARLRFLPNVVDTAHFTPAPKSDRNRLQLLGIGRLTPQKRFDRFLSVLAYVRQRSANEVKGLIVLSGPQDGRQALHEQAAALGLLGDGVEFHDAAPDTAPIYRAADVLLLTSDWEGTPNVILEAMASGVPVVATKVGGVPEVVRDGETGYLADAADERAVADALLKLIGDAQLRADIGRRARLYVEEHHSLGLLPMLLQGLYGAALS